MKLVRYIFKWENWTRRMEGPERNMGDMSLVKSGIHESCQKVQKKRGERRSLQPTAYLSMILKKCLFGIAFW